MVSHTKIMTKSVALDPSVGSVLDSVRHLARLLRQPSVAVDRSSGLSSAQLLVLRRLAAAPALSVNELAAATMTHQSSVSVVVRRLVERGLVERKVATKDARRIHLTLTRRARTLLRGLPVIVQDRLIAALLRLPPARRRILATDLRRLVLASLQDELATDKINTVNTLKEGRYGQVSNGIRVGSGDGTFHTRRSGHSGVRPTAGVDA